MEDDEIATAMGFSSFGGTKKRKHSSPSTKTSSSGANATQLGVRKKFAIHSPADHHAAELSAQIGHYGNETTIHPTTESQPSKVKGKSRQPPATGLADFLARGQALEEMREAPQAQTASNAPMPGSEAPTTISFGGEPITTAELDALRRGVKDENGDTAYFLPSFVEENPWAKLERRRR